MEFDIFNFVLAFYSSKKKKVLAFGSRYLFKLSFKLLIHFFNHSFIDCLSVFFCFCFFWTNVVSTKQQIFEHLFNLQVCIL